MKEIIFKEPFETKLNELKIKDKFVKLVTEHLIDETIEEALSYLDKQESWPNFILGSANLLSLPEKERKFWVEVSKK